jgi:hypothetical protein
MSLRKKSPKMWTNPFLLKVTPNFGRGKKEAQNFWATSLFSKNSLNQKIAQESKNRSIWSPCSQVQPEP